MQMKKPLEVALHWTTQEESKTRARTRQKGQAGMGIEVEFGCRLPAIPMDISSIQSTTTATSRVTTDYNKVRFTTEADVATRDQSCISITMSSLLERHTHKMARTTANSLSVFFYRSLANSPTIRAIVCVCLPPPP